MPNLFQIFNNFKIRTKLLVGFGAVFTFIVLIGGIIIFFNMKTLILNSNKNEMENIQKAVVNTVKASYQMTQEKVNSNLKVADYFFNGKTSLNPGKTIHYQIMNQITKEKSEIDIPAMLNENVTLSKKTEKVDFLTDMLGGAVTIFQVIPDGLLRISTSVKKEDGSRAIGTFIPKESPVYQSIMKGETYQGRAYVVNDWYVTAYKPLYDRNTKALIGAVFVGLEQNRLDILKEKILDLKIGKRGFVQIFDSTGKQIIHPDQSVEGTIRNTFQHKEMIRLKETGGTLTARQNSSVYNEKGKMKIYHFTYFPEMDWIISIDVYEDEMNDTLMKMTYIIIASCVLCGVISLILSIILSGLITRIVRVMAEKLKTMISNTEKADLTARIDIVSKDEIGEVASYFNEFLAALNDDIFQVEKASYEIKQASDSSKEISEKSDKNLDVIKSSIVEIDQQTENATSGIEELTATLEEMSRNIDSIMNNIMRQASAVEEGASSIEEMVRNIDNTASMSKKSHTLSNNLNEVAIEGGTAVKTSVQSIKEVSDYSQQILKLVGLITNIAKQTNLLAMNAAIEAAHAGEAGKGFAIVADEIRRLSEDTNKNARDISDVVGSIVGRIEESVRVAEKAGLGLDTITAYAQQNVQIIGQLNIAMAEQNNGAKDILKSTEELVRITEEVKLSMQEQKNATDEFAIALRDLRDLSISNKDNIEQHVDSMNSLIKLQDQIKDIIKNNQILSSNLHLLVDKFVLEDRNMPSRENTALKLVD